MHVSDVRDLLTHMEWADAAIWRTVLAAPSASASEEIRSRLHHIHVVQHVYLQLWRGEPFQPRDLGTFSGLDDIAAWARTFYPQAQEWAAALQDPDLGREIHFPWKEDLARRFGVARPATLAQTILQVALHSTHHRGQLLMRLRQLGAEPPMTDFIAWVWSGRPTVGPAVPPA